jgi:protein-S-isoprenylcysteine O-methyltransferase Ste14
MSRYSKWAEKEHSEAARVIALLPAGVLFLLLIPYTLLVISPSLDARLGLDRLSPSPAGFIIGALLLAVGLLFAQWSIFIQFTHGRGTPLPMIPTQRLITTGPFRYCRNPMTLGTILAYLGLSIAAATTVGIILVVACAALLLTYLKRMEEGELAERFGEEYLAYRRDVPFIIPRIRRRR